MMMMIGYECQNDKMWKVWEREWGEDRAVKWRRERESENRQDRDEREKIGTGIVRGFSAYYARKMAREW